MCQKLKFLSASQNYIFIYLFVVFSCEVGDNVCEREARYKIKNFYFLKGMALCVKKFNRLTSTITAH